MLHARAYSPEPSTTPAATGPVETDDLDQRSLPRPGTSPAIDLQRRLGEAALRGFYQADAPRRVIDARKVAVIGLTALACWGAVFGIGAAMIG